ncbi:hypothetical protein HMI54_011651 [Coelomomyces lativittatus]|nr:hypothetical protein HMI54_011651 [Coelomomyces lativittatus]
MEPFEFTPPRLHLDLLRSPSIQQKNPLRTIQHLRLQLIDIRDEVLQFQKEHQAWCQESHQVFCKQLQAPFYFLPNLPDLPSTDHVKNMIEPLYLISEQVRYDLCERQRLPDEIYLNYLSENLEPPDILCHTFLNEVQTLRNSLKPYWSSLVKKVVFQQTQLKDLEKTIVEYQSMMNHMKEVHLKLKRTLSLGNETSWSPKKFQLPSFDPNGQDFNCVIQEIKLIQVDSNQRMFLIDAFEKLAKYKKSQVHLSAFERELNERVQKDFNIKSIEVLEANREKKNQQHLSIIWELRQKHRTEIQ